MWYTMFQRFINLNMIFILYYLLHMKMKKMLVGALLGMFAVAGFAVLPNYASADSAGISDTWNDPKGNDLITGKAQTWSQLLTSIKKTINWLLGILATVAVAICLYAGFIMVTSAGDEKKYEKGLTILKYAAIGLVIVGVSWLIVSAVYWFTGLQAGSGNSELVWATGTSN